MSALWKSSFLYGNKSCHDFLKTYLWAKVLKDACVFFRILVFSTKQKFSTVTISRHIIVIVGAFESTDNEKAFNF